jgi:6-pyruvoyltetrahydropterin/6-carboxytetrahydropterin synthase
MAENGLDRGVVTDFNHLKKFFKWIDKVLDHRFIVDISDPALGKNWLPALHILQPIVLEYLRNPEEEYYALLEEFVSVSSHGPAGDIYGGITVVSFVPTAELLVSWLSREINKGEYLPEGVSCVGLEFYETPKSKAIWKE